MEVWRITSTQELLVKLAEQVPEMETKELTKTRIEIKVPVNQVRLLAETLQKTLPDISGELVSGVDLSEDKYEVLWFLWSHSQKLMVILKSRVEGPTPSVTSLTDLWTGLEWHERETWEMFGIVFEGHPNLDLLLLSEDLRGKYPLRKSFVINRERVKEATVAPPRPKRPPEEASPSEVKET
ncbi:MAG: NADH-quinone oxidoreductase subunit C [Candidatus Heimdallarchaeota archaeon]